MNFRAQPPAARSFLATTILFSFLGFSETGQGWGTEGHAATGILAMTRLHPAALEEITHLLGSVDGESMLEACNWPDVVRETDEWDWSAPQHYINLPPGVPVYSRSRDCPDQMCATEAIKKYAVVLGNKQLDLQQRRQSFAWLCHLTGDLHQPLHAGYASDRGGNNYEITVAGERSDLHTYWDHILINDRTGDWQTLVKLLKIQFNPETADKWDPLMVERWTEESHALVDEMVYPSEKEITDLYAQNSWELIQQRIVTAASRLALIINTVLPADDLKTVTKPEN
jgi:hypothetical protein